MTTDPFQHFGEQQRSYELLDQHREMLAADARDLLSEHPEIEVVGLIVDGDASEAAVIREALESATGQTFPGQGFLGIVPRKFVLEIVRANAPATLDWLPASSIEGRRVLPMIAMTKSGVRFGAIALDMESN